MTVPHWMQRHPISSRHLPVQRHGNSNTKVSMAKTAMVFMGAILGYYYTKSESLLEKYSTPSGYYIQTSRATALIDAPSYNLNLPQEQQQAEKTHDDRKPEYQHNQELEKEEAPAVDYASMIDVQMQLIEEKKKRKLDKEDEATAVDYASMIDEQMRLIEEKKIIASEIQSSHATPVDSNSLNTSASISYVHYTGCCGLGHRLARMSNAYHAAQRLNFAVQGTWPSCNKTNVYEHLFEEEDWMAPGNNYTHSGQVVKVNNEVPGYKTVSRGGYSGGVDSGTCNTCHSHKIDSDYQFYNQLLQRYRKRDQAEEFLRKHKFDQHTVIGMHVRAGNGEGGDFENKDRGINNTTKFVQRVRENILALVNTNNKEWKDPPLLFLATDTAAMVDLLREAMANDKIPIVELPQIRAAEGAGILFGDKKNRKRRNSLRAEQKDRKDEEEDTRQQCLLGWDQAFMDMMLLASSDVVVATRRSSFVQTIPLSITMGRKDRKVGKPYCEISQDSLLEMTCHGSYMDWCCCKDCIAQEDKERRKENKRPNTEYVKQFRSDLWDTPVLELYENKMKPTIDKS